MGIRHIFCPEVIRTAAAEGIIVFALPPHTTRLSQPLDKGVFAPLKVEWRKAVRNFISKNPGNVTRYEFSALFAKAWSNAMTLPNIVAGFRVTGVCPFNRNAIRLPSEAPTKFDPEALVKSTGIKYIPLYSPVRSHRPSKPKSISLHDKAAGLPSTPVISPVEHNSYPGFDEFGYSFSSYSPCSSTPVELRSRAYSGENPSLNDVSFLGGSLSVHKYHLERSGSEPNLHVVKQPCLGKLLHTPRPPNKIPTLKPKSSGRVLTSLENLRMMEERERKKQEEVYLKEQCKKEREKKSWRMLDLKKIIRRPVRSRQRMLG